MTIKCPNCKKMVDRLHDNGMACTPCTDAIINHVKHKMETGDDSPFMLDRNGRPVSRNDLKFGGGG